MDNNRNTGNFKESYLSSEVSSKRKEIQATAQKFRRSKITAAVKGSRTFRFTDSLYSARFSSDVTSNNIHKDVTSKVNELITALESGKILKEFPEIYISEKLFIYDTSSDTAAKLSYDLARECYGIRECLNPTPTDYRVSLKDASESLKLLGVKCIDINNVIPSTSVSLSASQFLNGKISKEAFLLYLAHCAVLLEYEAVYSSVSDSHLASIKQLTRTLEISKLIIPNSLSVVMDFHCRSTADDSTKLRNCTADLLQIINSL